LAALCKYSAKPQSRGSRGTAVSARKEKRGGELKTAEAWPRAIELLQGRGQKFATKTVTLAIPLLVFA